MKQVDGLGAFYLDSLTIYDYYPFGMLKPGRYRENPGYRYGFNGKEKDDDIKGTGNSYDYGARFYDSRVGRWLSRDPRENKYPGSSPFVSFANNPIIIIDPDGEDAKISITGNTVTIKSKIYIYGSGASAVQAKRMQTNIMNAWDKGWTYTDKPSGKTYNVKFDVSVECYDKKDPKNDPLIIPDAYNPFSRNNYIKIGATKKEVSTSYVTNGDEGLWRGYGIDPSPHEFGHLIGLDDRYFKRSAKPGWTGNIMAEPAGLGVVQQKNIDAVVGKYVRKDLEIRKKEIDEYKKNVPSRIKEPERKKAIKHIQNMENTYEINESNPSW